MLESPHQNRLIMENFDFKETFFNKKREMERERERERGEGKGEGEREGGYRSVSPGL